MKVNKTQWEFIGNSAGWLGRNDQLDLTLNKLASNKTLSSGNTKKVKVSKSKWKEAGKKAGWLKIASIGKFDNDTSDVLEALVIRNKLLPNESILSMAKSDSFLMERISDMEITDGEILSYIDDIRTMYRLRM